MKKILLALVVATVFFAAGCTTVIHPGRPAPPPFKIRVWVPGHYNVCGITGAVAELCNKRQFRYIIGNNAL